MKTTTIRLQETYRPIPRPRPGRAPRSLALPLTVLLVALAPFPAAWAAEGVLTDAAGDAVATVNGQPAPAPLVGGSATGSADLVALDVAESLSHFEVVLRVADMQQPPPAAEYAIDYTWMDATYRILIQWTNEPGAAPFTMADLLLANGDDYKGVMELDFVHDPAAGTFAVQLPKSLVVSLEGHAPVRGDAISGLTVTSRVFAPSAVEVVDRMPDEGAGSIPVTVGGESTGHLVFEANDPVRVSNGGATTFLYQGWLQNTLAEPDVAKMRVEGLPEGWSARIPGLVQVPASGETPVYAVVSIPFGHEHGGSSGFDLVATSEKDPASTARTRFGVLHTPVPMPAGHHSEVYLHATPTTAGAPADVAPQASGSMNTLADHARDAPEASPTTVDGVVEWRIPLGPQLAMGLDFDTERTGSLVGSVIGRSPGSATLEAALVLERADDEAGTLATATPLDVALDAQAATPFSFTLLPTPESDYLPYDPGVNMVLVVRLTPSVPAAPTARTTPTLDVASFLMSLPLNEFHDQPALNDEELPGTLKLATRAPLEKQARPGTTAAYVFELTNTGAADDDVVLEVAGNDAALGVLAPVTELVLGAGASRAITLGVAVPADAQDDERLDVVLVARSRNDPANIALAHTTTVVNKAAANPDEQGVVDAANAEGKDTPLGVWTVLVAIGIVAHLRSRR